MLELTRLHKRGRVRQRGSIRSTRLEKGSFPLNLFSTWHYIITYSVEMQEQNVTQGRCFTSLKFLGLESRSFVEPVILFFSQRTHPLTTNDVFNDYCIIALSRCFLYSSSSFIYFTIFSYRKIITIDGNSKYKTISQYHDSTILFYSTI